MYFFYLWLNNESLTKSAQINYREKDHILSSEITVAYLSIEGWKEIPKSSQRPRKIACTSM